MALKLSDDLKALVHGANFAHLATLMRDGSPQVAPVWVDLDEDFILVSTGEGSLKAKNSRRDSFMFSGPNRAAASYVAA